MIIEEATMIPDWLKEGLDKNCPYCSNKYEIGLSPNGSRVTKHYCPNVECPGTVATKMAFMWTLLGVDGIKFGRSLELIKTHKIKRHLDAIPFVLDEKPTIDSTMFMRISCIEGIDDSWGKVCDGKHSLEEIIETPDAQRYMTPHDLESIRYAQHLFNIVYPEKQEYDSVLNITIMMTGSIMNLEDRVYLVHALNQKYKGLLKLGYSKSKRKTGIFALVKESTSAVTGKVSTALEAGIPIMTPEEFILRVDEMIKERLGDDYGNYDI